MWRRPWLLLTQVSEAELGRWTSWTGFHRAGSLHFPARAPFSDKLVWMSSSPAFGSGISLFSGRNAADREVVERRGRIGLRPEAHAARRETPVAVVEEQRAVEPSLDVIARDNRPHRVPLAERGRTHAGALEHAAASVVVVEAEIVLERVRTDEVVPAVGEPENNSARGVFPPRDRL